MNRLRQNRFYSIELSLRFTALRRSENVFALCSRSRCQVRPFIATGFNNNNSCTPLHLLSAKLRPGNAATINSAAPAAAASPRSRGFAQRRAIRRWRWRCCRRCRRRCRHRRSLLRFVGVGVENDSPLHIVVHKLEELPARQQSLRFFLLSRWCSCCRYCSYRTSGRSCHTHPKQVTS